MSAAEAAGSQRTTQVYEVSNDRANFSAMQSQATTAMAYQVQNWTSNFGTSVCSVVFELRDMFKQKRLPIPDIQVPDSGPQFFVNDGYVVLLNSTELTYDLPDNTTLVEVLGPSGQGQGWEGDSQCYAVFDPRPSWWQSPNFPTSISRKPTNSTEQTMFLLPVDPAVKFKLRVGGLGQNTSCQVSAVRTYPLF